MKTIDNNINVLLGLYTCGNEDASVIRLGQLRLFLNEICRSLPDNTPIMLNCTIKEEVIKPCVQILADEESIELYSL